MKLSTKARLPLHIR
jgi:hypothetical protein